MTQSWKYPCGHCLKNVDCHRTTLWHYAMLLPHPSHLEPLKVDIQSLVGYSTVCQLPLLCKNCLSSIMRFSHLKNLVHHMQALQASLHKIIIEAISYFSLISHSMSQASTRLRLVEALASDVIATPARSKRMSMSHLNRKG